MKKIKLKDLPGDQQLADLKLFIPASYRKEHPELSATMFIVSGWHKGLWLTKALEDGRIYPISFDDFKDIEDWKVEVDNKSS